LLWGLGVIILDEGVPMSCGFALFHPVGTWKTRSDYRYTNDYNTYIHRGTFRTIINASSVRVKGGCQTSCIYFDDLLKCYNTENLVKINICLPTDNNVIVLIINILWQFKGVVTIFGSHSKYLLWLIYS